MVIMDVVKVGGHGLARALRYLKRPSLPYKRVGAKRRAERSSRTTN